MKRVSLSLIVDEKEIDSRKFIEHDNFAYNQCFSMYSQLLNVAAVNNYSPCEITTKIEEIKVKEE